jgi:hypothetical protein
MANLEHLELLQRGVEVWNGWRRNDQTIYPNLGGAELRGANLKGINLSDADLIGADLSEVDLTQNANLRLADLRGADLIGAKLSGSDLTGANLSGADLSGNAKLDGAYLLAANLSGADLSDADLRSANLTGATLVRTNLAGADLTDAEIYGVSAWDAMISEGTKQHNLMITPEGEPAVTVDDLEVAQFIYLILHNQKLQEVVDTVGRKGVLVLGRFTKDRIVLLERLREALRRRGYVPIVFNFDKPRTKDFTETVRLLGGMARFVIADITNPKSAPLELQTTIPAMTVPFQPIIAANEQLWSKHRGWVFDPIQYSSIDKLVETLDTQIIARAEARFNELVLRRAQTMPVRQV